MVCEISPVSCTSSKRLGVYAFAMGTRSYYPGEYRPKGEYTINIIAVNYRL